MAQPSARQNPDREQPHTGRTATKADVVVESSNNASDVGAVSVGVARPMFLPLITQRVIANCWPQVRMARLYARIHYGHGHPTPRPPISLPEPHQTVAPV